MGRGDARRRVRHRRAVPLVTLRAGALERAGSGWRLDGLYGQYILVVPACDAVVTITAHEEEHDHRLVEIAAEVIGAV